MIAHAAERIAAYIIGGLSAVLLAAGGIGAAMAWAENRQEKRRGGL